MKGTLILVGHHSITRRRLSPDLEEAVNEYAPQLGKVVWAWNYCHSAFAILFASLATPNDPRVALNMWHTRESDLAQRQLLIAAAEIVLSKKRRVLKRLLWADKRAEELSKMRNDFVHMARGFTPSPKSRKVVLDTTITAPRRAARLKGKDLSQLARLLRGDLVALAHYVSTLHVALLDPQHYSWPRRPRLQTTQEYGRRSKKKARSRRREPQPPPSS